MRDVRAILDALLAKTVARGATPAEEAAAQAKAAELALKYGMEVRPKSSAAKDAADWIREAMRKQQARSTAYSTTRVGNIGDFCFQMLGRDLGGEGYTYNEILRALARRFPNAKTKVASLRWYETRMRKSGLFVPKRRLG